MILLTETHNQIENPEAASWTPLETEQPICRINPLREETM